MGVFIHPESANFSRIVQGAAPRGPPLVPRYVLDSGKPILGICYGMQLLAHQLGGEVEPGTKREYGPAVVRVSDPPAAHLSRAAGRVLGVDEPRRRRATAAAGLLRRRPPATTRPSPRCGTATALIGIQFHPEVVAHRFGAQLLGNFLIDVCGCTGDWTTGVVRRRGRRRPSARQVGRRAGDLRALGRRRLGGGRGAGASRDRRPADLHLRRQRPAARGRAAARGRHVRAAPGHAAGARRRGRPFLGRLAGVTDPEEKRRIVGDEFIRVFARRRASSGTIDFLAQGTLYPDVIESTSHDTASAASRIKTHHNVGGLPENLPFQLIEPLRYLFKDEVREVGAALGLPDEIVWRHPFPGPGLASASSARSPRERLETLRARRRDRHGRDPRRRACTDSSGRASRCSRPCARVGVMGDYRTYDNVVAVRMVQLARRA